jgi:hypothetical protein
MILLTLISIRQNYSTLDDIVDMIYTVGKGTIRFYSALRLLIIN